MTVKTEYISSLINYHPRVSSSKEKTCGRILTHSPGEEKIWMGGMEQLAFARYYYHYYHPIQPLSKTITTDATATTSREVIVVHRHSRALVCAMLHVQVHTSMLCPGSYEQKCCLAVVCWCASRSNHHSMMLMLCACEGGR